MNKTSLILFIILVICWTLNPFLKKGGLGALTPEQFWIINIVLCFIFTVIYLFYLYCNDDFNFLNIGNITRKQSLSCIFAALTSVIAGLCLMNLLKDENVTSIIPQGTPISIILTLIVGYSVFNEGITFNQGLGGLIIIFGLYIFNT